MRNKGADQKVFDDFLAASELEAEGKREQAKAEYEAVVAALSAKVGLSDAQSKLLSSARQAVSRLAPTAAPAAPVISAKPGAPDKPVAAGPKHSSIFTPEAGDDPGGDRAPPGAAPRHREPIDDDLPTGIDSDEPASVESIAPDPTPVPATAAPDRKGIDGHLADGQRALLEGDYQNAMSAFRNALDIDRKSVLAMHGVGIAFYQMGETGKAIEQLEKALRVEANRAVVHNLAVVFIKDNPMRAAKIVRDYLARPGTPLDEPLQNVLGSALTAASATEARGGTVFLQLRDFYIRYDRQLASARTDGMKRWGMQWIPGPEADAKHAAGQTETPQFPQHLQMIPVDVLTPDKHPKQQ